MEMQNSENGCSLVTKNKVGRIGEPTEQGASYSIANFRKLKWCFPDAIERLPHFEQESPAKTGSLALIPCNCGGDVFLSLWPQNQPSCHFSPLLS